MLKSLPVSPEGIFYEGKLTAYGIKLVVFVVKTIPMKKIIIFCLSIGLNFLQAQAPYLIGYTVIPQNPTTNDFIKIVTEVHTPNQGILVDQMHTVNSSTKDIVLHGCYWQGMLTAIQEHVDTFMIGQLPVGNYTIHRNAYMSTTQQHCSRIDSNKTTNMLQVTGLTTSIEELGLNGTVRVYPNPSKEILFCSGSFGESFIYSANGSLVKQATSRKDGSIDIRDLADGLYFIRFSQKDKTSTVKFVKGSQ